MLRVQPTPAFVEALKRLSEGRQSWVISRVHLFQTNPNDKILRFRELRCAPGHHLIDSIRYDRIVLRKDAEDLFALVDCGGHEILDEWEKRLGRR
jgi:hypothetical protein